MISEVSADARGYDPYNSADQTRVVIAVNKKFARNALPRESDADTDAKIRRGFKYLENHPQIAAEIFARSLDIARRLEKAGAQRYDADMYQGGFAGQLNPPI